MEGSILYTTSNFKGHSEGYVSKDRKRSFVCVPVQHQAGIGGWQLSPIPQTNYLAQDRRRGRGGCVQSSLRFILSLIKRKDSRKLRAQHRPSKASIGHQTLRSRAKLMKQMPPGGKSSLRVRWGGLKGRKDGL